MTNWMSVTKELPQIESKLIVYLAAHESWHEAFYIGDDTFEIIGDPGWEDKEEVTHWAYIDAPEDEEKL